jgi:long-chain fatty acid transport protein
MLHPINRLVAALALAGAANLVHAAGFALIEQNASGLGNAYAGQAAVAEDASTLFFNPAGMTELSGMQMVAVGSLIQPSIQFSSTSPGGGQGGDAGSLALVPALYFSLPLTPTISAGLGINAPFGLKTDYAAGWVGRFQALESEIQTVNINPSIAWKMNDQVSFGAGVNVQRIDATLSNNIFPLVPGSLVTIKGDDYGWGYNLGMLWKVDPSTRLGLAYRSKIDYTLSGQLSSNFAGLPSGDVTADITMPATASLSLVHKLMPSVDLLADVTWTGWSVFDQLRIVRTSGGVVGTPTKENWSDSWRYSLGATWHQDQTWTWRAGVAYDQTPVSDTYRTARIPDESRIWVALGGQYRVDKQNLIDFGYAHLFVASASINSPAGTYDNYVNILSVQYTHNF